MSEIKQIKVGTADYDIADPNISLESDTTSSTITIHGSTLTLSLSGTTLTITTA